jgi:hypothetical protein
MQSTIRNVLRLNSTSSSSNNFSLISVDESIDNLKVLRFITCFLPNMHYTVLKPINSIIWQQVLTKHNHHGPNIILHYNGGITDNIPSSPNTTLLETLLSNNLRTSLSIVQQQLYKRSQMPYLTSLNVSIDTLYKDLSTQYQRQILILDLCLNESSDTELQMMNNTLQTFFSTKEDIIVLGCLSRKNGVLSKLADPVSTYLTYIYGSKFNELSDNVLDGHLFLNDTSKAILFGVIMDHMASIFKPVSVEELNIMTDMALYQLVLSYILLINCESGDSSKHFFCSPILMERLTGDTAIWNRLQEHVGTVIKKCTEKRTLLSEKFALNTTADFLK